MSDVIHNKLPSESTPVLGDFNLGDISWSNNLDINGISLSSLPSGCLINKALIDSLAYNNLFQCNPVCNIGNRILDLVLSNKPESIVVNEAEQPIHIIHLYLWL